jgi:hypothetical protein
LLNELQTVRVLLAELETDRSRQLRAVDKIFRLATNHPGRVPFSLNRSPHVGGQGRGGELRATARRK